MSGSGFGGELGLSALGGEPYDGERLLAALPAALEGWRFGRDKRCTTLLACRELAGVLDGLEGSACSAAGSASRSGSGRAGLRGSGGRRLTGGHWRRGSS